MITFVPDHYRDITTPIWVWDQVAECFLWANSSGLVVFDADDLASLCSLRFDRAMPAVNSLARMSRETLPSNGRADRLVFWSDNTSIVLNCRCRSISLDEHRNVLLLEGMHEPLAFPATEPPTREKSPERVAKSKEQRRGSAEAGAEAETEATSSDKVALEEIAKMIRAGGVAEIEASEKNSQTSPPLVENSDLSDGAVQSEPPVDQRHPLASTSLRGADPATEPVEFFAKVSHEVRTPLNSIIGFAEIMKDERFGPIDNEKYKGYVTDIHTSAHYALSLINELLDFAKVRAGRLDMDFKEIDIRALAGDALRAISPQALDRNLTLTNAIADNVPNVVVDHRSMMQVFLNLLTNAAKFTPEGGKIDIVSNRLDNGALTIAVCDTGIGMKHSDIMKALEPFRQLDTNVGHGTGLGLPLAKALARANRAEFQIESEPGVGTCVTVSFPPNRLAEGPVQ